MSIVGVLYVRRRCSFDTQAPPPPPPPTGGNGRRDEGVGMEWTTAAATAGPGSCQREVAALRPAWSSVDGAIVGNRRSATAVAIRRGERRRQTINWRRD